MAIEDASILYMELWHDDYDSTDKFCAPSADTDQEMVMTENKIHRIHITNKSGGLKSRLNLISLRRGSTIPIDYVELDVEI